jgi:hypothetical protein
MTGGSLYVMLSVMSNIYLGTYWDEASCRNAIREKLIAQVVPPSLQVNPEYRKRGEAIVAQTIQYQNDYICVPKEVDKR